MKCIIIPPFLVSRLKQTWSELRDSVLQVYQDSMADSKDSLDKPDVTCLKGIFGGIPFRQVMSGLSRESLESAMESW